MRSLCFALLLAAALPAQRPKVLFVTHSAGFTHGVVKRLQKGKASFAGKKLTEIAQPQFDVHATFDCSEINEANLAEYRAVVFYTTGELPIDAAGREAFMKWIRAGGGFVGIHCATDTFYQWPEYGELIGGYFDGHPWHEDVTMRVEDRTHPSTALLGGSFDLKDEIYQFRDWSRERVNVLYTLDPESVKIEKGKRKDGDYASGWWRDYGEGRMFYTALGHRFEVWNDRRFQKHLLAGIRWAMNCEEEFGRPQTGAEVLDADAWEHPNGRANAWTVDGDVMSVKPRTGSVITKKPYGDFRMHVEFRTPERVEGKEGQSRGNSGVYIQRRYEVQILDSFGEDPKPGGCGALYRQRKADANRCAEPGAWQFYDIWFRQPRWEGDKKTENARITVIHNGVFIHDDVELKNKTGAGQKEGPQPGPILLQDHGSPVSFRNIWIQSLDSSPK